MDRDLCLSIGLAEAEYAEREREPERESEPEREPEAESGTQQHVQRLQQHLQQLQRVPARDAVYFFETSVNLEYHAEALRFVYSSPTCPPMTCEYRPGTQFTCFASTNSDADGEPPMAC